MVFFLIAASFAFGQLDSNSVTVTASRNSSIQPDQALFAVSVNSDLNATLSDILAAVQPAGLTLANFSSVGTTTLFNQGGDQVQNQQGNQWTFATAVPISNIKATLATLTALQKSVPLANKTLSISFSIQGTQVSQQLQQSQACDTTGLLADARTKAQDLANAAGRTVGGTLALSTSISTSVGAAVSPYPASSSQICSATVKFALLGSN